MFFDIIRRGGIFSVRQMRYVCNTSGCRLRVSAGLCHTQRGCCPYWTALRDQVDEGSNSSTCVVLRVRCAARYARLRISSRCSEIGNRHWGESEAPSKGAEARKKRSRSTYTTHRRSAKSHAHGNLQRTPISHVGWTAAPWRRRACG